MAEFVASMRPDTELIGDVTAFPYDAVGKLFMKFGDETTAGTAWIVGDRTIITAGHCLFDHGTREKWPEAVAFVPGYDGSRASLSRQWAAEKIHILAGWHDDRIDKYRYDLAAVTLRTAIGASAGRLAWAGNLGRSDSPFRAVGYPMVGVPGFAFDGRRMWGCVGRYAGGTNPVRMMNNMSDGCSGGPWLVTRSGSLYVAGINSYRPGTSDQVQSPVLGRGFENLVHAAN